MLSIELLTMRRWISLVCLIFLVSGFIPSAQAQSPQWAIAKKNFNLDTAGFLAPNSVRPGEQVRAFVTCPSGSFKLTAYRMGYYQGITAKPYWSSKSLPCLKQAPQTINPVTHLSESHWQASTQIPTKELQPGFYLLKITSSHQHQAFMPLVVRQNDARGRVVLVIPTMTSLAYNTWHGVNAYRGKSGFADRARIFSFDRPNDWGYGSGKYLFYVHPLLVTAERLGLNIDYVTDVDVATIPNLLQGARAYVSAGHDEYWTGQERTAVEQARSNGTNLLFFGANVAYWETRLAPSPLGPNREMILYKSAMEDPNKTNPTVRFRDTNRPESALTGQNYNCYPATGNFTVSAPKSFIFEGTHATSGEQFSGIIGPEVDHFVTPNSFIGRIQVVAKSPVTCGGEKRSSSSDVVYGVSPSGAGTISVGTMRWVERGLTGSVPARTRALVTKFTENLLIAAASGPIGLRYPVS
ncbi:hypothetical protein GALL_318410 [mine drainage metagenome]|uniref:N,N-dimethylformamidase beta subunit-like C-terminal domain-containing protein n=1 Tax=mine drainage metagenome TaxID=410659 RepID=A0A1J5QRN9_9ZZZZ